MSNYLVTLNTNKALCLNSRASHEHAARRWGCEYLVLPAPWGELHNCGAFGAKLEMDRLPVPGGSLAGESRVCWVDADTVVRSDAPNPFDLVPPGSFGGVPNDQGDTHDQSERDHAGWWNDVAARVGCATPWNPRRYINGGLMVFDLPLHGELWELARRAARAHVNEASAAAVNPMVEQTALNVAIEVTGCALHVLPRGMNRLGKAAWRPGLVMKDGDYIHHCASLGDLRGDKSVPLSRVDWRIAPCATWHVVGGGPSRELYPLPGPEDEYRAATNGGLKAVWDEGMEVEWAWLSDPVAVERHAGRIGRSERVLTVPESAHKLRQFGIEPTVMPFDTSDGDPSDFTRPYTRRRFSGLMLLECVVREARPGLVRLYGFDGYVNSEGGADDERHTREIIAPFMASMVEHNPQTMFFWAAEPHYALPDGAEVIRV